MDEMTLCYNDNTNSNANNNNNEYGLQSGICLRKFEAPTDIVLRKYCNDMLVRQHSLDLNRRFTMFVETNDGVSDVPSN